MFAKKLLVAMLILVMAGALIFAGGKKETAQSADKPVTFSFWHIGTADVDKAYYQSVVDEYMTAHPNVKIEVTILENEAFKSKLTTVMQSGNPPDVFHSWGGGVLSEYAKAGLLQDITKEVKGTAFGDSMAAGVWGVYAADGKQYGAANDMGGVTFWYNKDLLAKVGYNSFPTTWDDFLVLVGKLKAAGITPISLGGGDKWPAMYYFSYLALRLGGSGAFANLNNGKGFNDEVFIKAAQMVKQLVDMKPFQDGFLGATYTDQGALMGNGMAAMELMGQWAPIVQKDSSTNKTGLGDKLGCAPFPGVSSGKGAITEVMGGGGGMAIGKNAPKEAVDFLKFLFNKENNSKQASVSGIIPTVKGAEAGMTDANLKQVKAIVDQCTFFQLYPDQFLAPAVGGALNDSVQTLLAGTATPEQACAAIQRAYLQ